MFLGSYTPSFDLSTRRIALPKKIREFLTRDEIILSKGYEACIFGFDQAAWEKESRDVLERPLTDKGSRNVRRFFFSNATVVVLDDQGRFVIPGSLLEYSGLGEPVIIGAGDHFEIWDRELWVRYQGDLEETSK